MMDKRQIKTGIKMMFGLPTNPMPAAMAKALGQIVAQIPGICEAYIPQCHVQGDDEARQVVVIGVEKKETIPEIVNILAGKMKLLFPPGVFMEIMSYPSSSLPQAARVKQCCIFGAPKKPWWKIW